MKGDKQMEDLTKLFASNQRYLIVFLVFVVLDIITGIIKALINKDLKSCIFREGILKKALEIILIVVGFACDWAFNVSIVGMGVLICQLVMEAYSILENISEYIPIPEKLKEFLEEVKERK